MSLFKSVRTIGQSQTEIKVRKATDDDESSGATGTLMSELSVLTYSPKTLREITQVIRKRLNGNYRKSSHKNAVHMLKTLTLISYLVNNGSNEFVAWIRAYAYLVDTLKEFDVSDRGDAQMAEQIRILSAKLSTILRDDELLKQRRNDLTQFRSSISTPGRKSTDNSHLKVQHPNKLPQREAIRGTRSLEISRTPRYGVDHQALPLTLDPLAEEESVDKENNDAVFFHPRDENGEFRRRGVTRFHANNPFA
ncbi:LAFE_0D05160g1_1 [Lachancea fermentati]|uniref:LAFE_0D05160g1_1 n=1 Tax=Lachancea fermentati TaxID=4955 RepID=A0A1G4MBA2_LACFM|nr:LAFE_0D05160g1_1 [Lachancea fermentati]